LALFQILLACDNLDEENCGQTNMEELSGEHKSLINFMIDNFGIDS
jgi:hypothetical protein